MLSNILLIICVAILFACLRPLFHQEYWHCGEYKGDIVVWENWDPTDGYDTYQEAILHFLRKDLPK